MLDVKDLTIEYGQQDRARKIVEDISFHLDRGDSLGIVGESGSGKTVTALSLLGLLPQSMEMIAGRILYTAEGGKQTDLGKLHEKEIESWRGRIAAMVFQEPMSSLNPTMKCGEQVSEAVRLHQDIKGKQAFSKTIELLEEVNLPAARPFYDKYPHQLSGGQRQRIMIAIALAGNPEILIADEPTTALDLTVQKKILELLSGIRRKRSMSLLFISHDLGVVRSVCDAALVMYRGKILEQGSTEKIFSKPGHPYTRELLACRPSQGSRNAGAPVPAVPPGKTRHYTPLPPLLEVRNLQASYTVRKNLFGKTVESLHAVDRISFHIEAGETLGLIGESGCGKSTLGRTVISLIRSRKGDILFKGESILDWNGRKLTEYRRNVQFIFQDPFSSLNPGIRIGNVLTEVMRVHGLNGKKSEREKAARDLLEKVGLSQEHFHRYAHEFSGGQRQRIGIARALAANPQLVICDESVSSLDVTVQAQILDLLNELKDSFGLTYLFISHDLAVVRYMSDRIIVMRDGRLVESGNTDDLFHRPGTAYTKELIDSILE